MPNSWDGKTERRVNHTDHDTLIEVVQILKNQDELSKIVAINLKDHEIKDEINFTKIRGDILALQKVVWTATGIIVALDAIPKIGEIFHLLK